VAEHETPIDRTEGSLPPHTPGLKGQPLPAELRQWVLQQFSKEQAVAILQELRDKDGPELKNYLHELERAATQP
jgi:hypothetical protein